MKAFDPGITTLVTYLFACKKKTSIFVCNCSPTSHTYVYLYFFVITFELLWMYGIISIVFVFRLLSRYFHFQSDCVVIYLYKK